jgi:alanine racemase
VTIAVIPIGYADGFPRRPSHWGHVLIHGQPAPLIGRVCMDQAMVDVTHLQTRRAVRQGDEVVIIGQQGEATLDVDTIAERLQTNNYDVVSRIMARVPRVYLLPDRAEPIH